MENNLPNPRTLGSNPTEPRISPPPLPPISIRTMESDVKSMAQSGGGEPVPQMLNVNEPPKRQTPPPESNIKISIPGYIGSEEKIFNPETLPSDSTTPAKAGASSKSIIMIVLLVAIAVGLGGAGYFLVYPILFPGEKPPVQNPPVATETPTPTPTALIHRSLANSDKQEVVISLAMANTEQLPVNTPSLFKEIILNDAEGHPQAFSKYFSLLVPEINAADLSSAFEEDFTTFIYYNADGAWPGYIVKVREPAVNGQNLISKMENSSNLLSFYLENPGAKSPEGFKNGQVIGYPARYISFAKKSAALSYSWLKNKYLLIATNYAAAQEAVSRIIDK